VATFTPGADLPGGACTATASQSDGAGNSATTPVRNFTVDTTAPALTISAPADGARTKAPVASGTRGTAAGDLATVTVTVRSGANVVATKTDAGAGPAWSVDLAPLADGTYTVQAAQSNAAGKTTTTAARTFTVDTVAPALSFTAPANGSAQAATPALRVNAGTAPGDAGTVDIVLRNGATLVQSFPGTPVVNGVAQVQPAAVPAGSYTAQATQTDGAGNSASASVAFTVTTTTTAGDTPSGITVTGPVAVSPKLAGTSKKPRPVALTLTYAIATKDGSAPPTATTLTWLLPKQLVLKAGAFPDCTLSALQATGPSACKKAKVGSGSARIQVGAGAKAIVEDLTVTAFNGPDGAKLLLYVQGTSPVALQHVVSVALNTSGTPGYGRKLVASIPPAMQTPIPGVFAPLTRLSVKIQATTQAVVKHHQTTVGYVASRGCPSDKLLRFRLIAAFAKEPAANRPQVAPSTTDPTAPCTK
jgi:hypothetical protein